MLVFNSYMRFRADRLDLNSIPTASTTFTSTPPYSSDDPWGFGKHLVKRFPALKQRNFFVIQQHHATANHFDLRLFGVGILLRS